MREVPERLQPTYVTGQLLQPLFHSSSLHLANVAVIYYITPADAVQTSMSRSCLGGRRPLMPRRSRSADNFSREMLVAVVLKSDHEGGKRLPC